MKTLNDKLEFCWWMNKNGFSSAIPELYGTVKEPVGVHFPCIVKPRIGRSGQGITIATCEEALCNLNKECIIQQYIHGRTEYSGHFYVHKGEIKYSVYFKADYHDDPYVKTGAILNYVVECLDLRIFDEIFEKLEYTGFACANFKMNGLHGIKIFEINARAGGSVVGTKYWHEMNKAKMDSMKQ